MYENVNFKNTEGIKTKGSGDYVQNARLYEEIMTSKELGRPTEDFTKMVIVLATNLSRKLHYMNPDDKNDCIQFAIMDCLSYYNSFNPEKSKNAFAYLTSVCSNGFAKAWRKMGYHDFPASIMTRLDGGNVHSI